MKKHDNDNSLEDIFRELKSSVQAREEREKNQENDDDRMFLLSLLNSMKKFPENMKLEVRSQIIQIIANASYPTSNNPDTSSYNHAFGANSFNHTVKKLYQHLAGSIFTHVAVTSYIYLLLNALLRKPAILLTPLLFKY